MSGFGFTPIEKHSSSELSPLKPLDSSFTRRSGVYWRLQLHTLALLGHPSPMDSLVFLQGQPKGIKQKRTEHRVRVPKEMTLEQTAGRTAHDKGPASRATVCEIKT